MTKVAIAPNEVHDAVRASLYDDYELTAGELPGDAIVVAGIVRTFGFKPSSLEKQREKVTRWLNALPHQFHDGAAEDERGGWSFLNACMTEDGDQWTGEHTVMEELLCLGVALGLAHEVFDREMWPMLPGGMPYYVIHTGGGNDGTST